MFVTLLFPTADWFDAVKTRQPLHITYRHHYRLDRSGNVIEPEGIIAMLSQ